MFLLLQAEVLELSLFVWTEFSLLASHHTWYFSWVCAPSSFSLWDESPCVRGRQMECVRPVWFSLVFAPYPTRGWFQGKSKGRRGFTSPSVFQMLICWVGTDRGHDLNSFASGTSLPHDTIPRQLELAGHVTGTLPLLLVVCLLLCSSDEITCCPLKLWFYLTWTVAKLLKF